MLGTLADKILSGGVVSRDEALREIAPVGGVFELFAHANRLRERYRGDVVDLCSIVNAKSGACPEDCSYCAQSARARTGVERYPLLGKNEVIKKALEAKEGGAKRFCVVTSGKSPSAGELRQIAAMIGEIRKAGLLPCATLGILGRPELEFLRDSGLERYHHNLETSRRFFPEICSSHGYDDKLKTIEAVRLAGLSLCSGGIFGLGEDWEDRVDMAVSLRELGADSIPINFLIPVKGTRLEGLDMLPPLEALKIISLYRFLLPSREIRVCGGRLQCLGEFNSFVFMAGADGLLTGNYLTAEGRSPGADLSLINLYGLKTG